MGLITSSGQAGQASGCALQSNFFKNLKQTFQNGIMKKKKKKKEVSTSMVCAPLWFAGLNMASTHKNGYIRNTKGLLI